MLPVHIRKTTLHQIDKIFLCQLTIHTFISLGHSFIFPLLKIILKDSVPEVWDYPEMKSYLENKTKSNATEFLNEFLERNADRIDGVRKLVSYYAERPGVEKLGKHGLFSQIDEKINLDKVADEVSNHNGIVWTHVISLKREDAERLGYNNANAWKSLVRSS